VSAAPALTREGILAFLVREFPEAGGRDGRPKLKDYAHGSCRVVMPLDERTIRPGPSVSGPAIMAFGDVSAWVALLSVIGPGPLAVTARLNATFLRPAGLSDLACACSVLRAGRRIAAMLAEAMRRRDGQPGAHLTITYAIPDGARG